MNMRRLPTYYLSHGGGPWPWMKDRFGRMFGALEESLVGVRRELGSAPRAVLVISGHWEADGFRVASSPRPPMIYDYYGFPEATYHIRYDAPGSPELAARVQDLLVAGGVAAGLDPERGFDHGVFSLLKPIYPDADMPIVQLSMNANYDPALHLKVGELLAPLRDEGVVIVGSGASYHDMRGSRDGTGGPASHAFDAWLTETLVEADSQARRAGLERWAAAPGGRQAHPSEDHLIPLMVAAGAAGGDPGVRIYHEADFMGSIAISSFRFGSPPVEAPAQP